MRRRIAMTLAVGATAGLLLPAVAMAGTKTLNAAVKGDNNSKVKIEFKTREGRPTGVNFIKLRNVNSPCPEGGEFSKKFKKVGFSPLTLTFLGGGPVSQTQAAKISGGVDPKVTRIKDGTIEFFRIENGELGESCGRVEYRVPR